MADHVAEISPVDGHLLARRPAVNGWLLWARAGGTTR
jgi:hypothetical protein